MAKKGKKALEKEKTNTYGVSTAQSTSRLLAYVLDWAIGGIVTGIPAVFIYGMVTKKSDMFSDLYVFEASGYSKMYGLLAGALCLFMAIIYYIIIPLKKYPGQTLGKKIAKIQIKTWDDKNPTFKDLALRYAANVILETPMFIISRYIMQMITIMTRFYVESVWMYVGIAFTLVSAIMILYTKKHDAIHDLVAKTKVVEVKSNESKNY